MHTAIQISKKQASTDAMYKPRVGLSALVGGELVLYGLVLTLIFSAMGGVVVWHSESNRQIDQVYDLLATVEKTASVACYAGDRILAKEVVDGLLVNHSIVGATLVSDMGMLAESYRERSRADGGQVVSREIISPFNDSEVVGRISLFPSHSYIREQTVNYTAVNLFTLILDLLVIIAMAVWIIMRMVVKPVSVLSHGVDSIEAGTHAQLELQGPAEIRHLAESFNSLLIRNKGYMAMEQAMMREITRSERLLRTLVETSPDFILRFDIGGKAVFANPACRRVFGVDDNGAVWCPVMSGIPQPYRLRNMLDSGEPYKHLWEWQGDDGYKVCYEVIVVGEFNSPGDGVDGVLAIGRDISERVKIERQLEYEATHDSLTGVPNRAYFKERLSQAISAAGRDGRVFSLVFIDLDNFKDVNDIMGHDVGDELLKHVAVSLRNVLRDSDTLARLGGDEFVVLLEGFEPDMDMGGLVERIYAVLAKPCTIGGRIVHAGASLGIAVYPRDGEDVDSLMCNADTAMYAAKAGGRGTYRLFTADMHAEVNEWAILGQDMHRALEQGEFELHYQPKVTMADGSLSGFEALIRWRHPERGLISPARFIPLAERNGLINEIGSWVLNEACRQLASWRKEGLEPGKMAINLSAQQCRWGDFSLLINDSLLRQDLPGECLEVEITESAIMSNTEVATNMLRQLRELNVTVALDDFGTGYSSLSYLKRFPVDVLKIDRSFVSDIETDASDVEIIHAILAMAQSLGLIVVAEGVETAAQLEFLKNAGCSEYQGYYFSPPLAANEAAVFLRTTQSCLATHCRG